MKRNLLKLTLLLSTIFSVTSCKVSIEIENSSVSTEPTSSEVTSSENSSSTQSDSSESSDISNNSSSVDSQTDSSSSSSSEHHDSTPSQIISDEISINFLTFGNKYNGDSTFIKVGDVDILIDAGSRPGSASHLTSYIDTLCTDNKLEYVIATHADRDHIACFTTYDHDGIFDKYEVETLIDFPLTNKTTNTYKNYKAKRDQLVNEGKITHHPADYYFTDGEANEYNHIYLTDTVTMDILYNPYYFQKIGDENEYSVCMMLNQGDNHFLFTGDLELHGEEGMAQYYAKRGGLPHCKLFKGGHHGSKTSSNEVLLSQITPEIVCVCCCAGADEYTDNTVNQFPTQQVIDRIAKYTTNVFVTTAIKYTEAGEIDNGFEDLNGIITVLSTKEGKIKVHGSNNTIRLKDSEWFNREIVHYDSGQKLGLKPCRTWPDVTSMYTELETF